MDDRIKYVRIIDGIIMLVLFSLTACSKQSDFDAKSYVKSSLDAEYHRVEI
mgnify:FL=1